ncbi:MAG: hypothetical protein ACKPGF_02530 [Microcystis panniformis]
MVELIWLGRKLVGLRSRGDPLIDQVLFNQILQEALLVARSYLRDFATSSDFLYISPEIGWSSRPAIAILSGCLDQKGMQRGWKL